MVRGKITVSEPRGNYQFFCETLEPVGAGALQLAFEQLKKKLQVEGLFEATRKRPIPTLPKHVAVVTSPTGAAIRDILNILGRRFAGLRVTVIPAVVQGDSAPTSICAGIALAQKLDDVDVLIVGRGGGSIEDMWGFNDERVARAIVACRVPVISAVGHEIDFTIADFVADLRAPTPSAAAELVVKNAAELSERIEVLRKRLVRGWVNLRALARQRLTHSSQRLVDPKRRLQDLALRCDELTQRLEQAVERSFERMLQKLKLLMSSVPMWRRALEIKRSEWARLSSVLDSLSPLKVVERGYSITRLGDQVIKSAAQIKAGSSLRITFAQGSADVKVESVNKE